MLSREERLKTLTPRERAELDWEKEAAKLQVTHNEKLAEMQLEVAKLETKWTQIWRLPLALILLPIKLVAVFAVPISMFTKKDLPDDFWKFINL